MCHEKHSVSCSLCCSSHTCHNSFCPASPAHAVDSSADGRTPLCREERCPLRIGTDRSDTLDFIGHQSGLWWRREFRCNLSLRLCRTAQHRVGDDRSCHLGDQLCVIDRDHLAANCAERDGRARTAIPDPAGLWRGERSKPADTRSDRDRGHGGDGGKGRSDPRHGDDPRWNHLSDRANRNNNNGTGRDRSGGLWLNYQMFRRGGTGARSEQQRRGDTDRSRLHRQRSEQRRFCRSGARPAQPRRSADDLRRFDQSGRDRARDTGSGTTRKRCAAECRGAPGDQSVKCRNHGQRRSAVGRRRGITATAR